MKKATVTFKTVEAYIASFPLSVQTELGKVRMAILGAAPGVTEEISYGLPTVRMKGKVVLHYGAFQHHIGLYATPSGHAAFAVRLSQYKQGKGSVQFPLSDPMPLDLISDIAAFRLAEVQGETLKRPLPATATKKSPRTKDSVAAYMKALPAGFRKELDPVRKIILQADDQLQERIKWNAPSYHYGGVDLLTFGPYKGAGILLVVHHPSVVLLSSPLLTGTYKDRRLIRFANKGEAVAAGAELQRIVRALVQSVDSITNKNKHHAKTTI